MINKISKLGLEGIVLGLVGQGKNHREISKALRGMGHQITDAQVYGFTSKITPDDRNRLLQEAKAVDIANIEALEAVATRVLRKMETLLDQAIDDKGSDGYLAITSFSAQLGAWLDRLVKLKANQPDKVTIQVQYVINNFQTMFSTIQDVLLSNDEWAEAYAQIDARLKERLGPNWGRVDLTQPTAVATLAPMEAQEVAATRANQVGNPGEENLEWISRAEEKRRKKEGGKDERKPGCKEPSPGMGKKKGKTDNRRTAKDGKKPSRLAAKRMPRVQGAHDHKA